MIPRLFALKIFSSIADWSIAPLVGLYETSDILFIGNIMTQKFLHGADLKFLTFWNFKISKNSNLVQQKGHRRKNSLATSDISKKIPTKV